VVALKHFQSDDKQGICDAINEDGACIVESLISSDLCDQLVGDFMPFLDALPWGVDELGYKSDFYGSRTKRLHGLFSKSKAMEEILTLPRVLDVAQELLLANNKARDIRLSNTELMVLAEHQDVQDFHTDGGSWYRAQVREKQTKDDILISTNIALTEFTLTNGATRVVPGSHLWPEGRVPEAEEICQAVMPKGAALFYSGNVIHSGGANTDAMTRIGLYLGYVVSWLRPIENQMVTNDPADVLALSEQAKQLLDVVEGGFTVIA
tara:strand:- start:1390 stop:2184 length:795 start_codon:yes stop_codon:yes gene_type:complete